MKPITLKKALYMYVDALLENDIAPQLYLKGGDKRFHNIDQIDIMRDRICSNDGYWEYYEFILQYEGGENHLLFVEDKQNDDM